MEADGRVAEKLHLAQDLTDFAEIFEGKVGRKRPEQCGVFVCSWCLASVWLPNQVVILAQRFLVLSLLFYKIIYLSFAVLLKAVNQQPFGLVCVK